MIVISMALVLIGFVTLLLGVLGVGEQSLQLVYGSIGACLLAAVFLVAGVVRARPSRKPAVVQGADHPTWSGAVPPRTAPPESPPAHDESHVQVLSAREATGEAVAATSTAPLDLAEAGAARDAGGEGDRFAQALEGLGLDTVRVERLRGRFVTAERLAAAPAGEIAEVPGISAALAETIGAHLRSRG